jgi:hypothetical protein
MKTYIGIGVIEILFDNSIKFRSLTHLGHRERKKPIGFTHTLSPSYRATFS